MNIHEQVKSTPKVIEKCLKENKIRHPITMKQHDYNTNMDNAIIDDEIGEESNDPQLSNDPRHQKIRKKSFTKELGRLAHEAGV